jgi:hypothetical protein
MKKKQYIKPVTKKKCIIDENAMIMSSLNPTSPTSGLDNAPGYGGNDDGTHPVGAKHNIFWDDDNQGNSFFGE